MLVVALSFLLALECKAQNSLNIKDQVHNLLTALNQDLEKATQEQALKETQCYESEKSLNSQLFQTQQVLRNLKQEVLPVLFRVESLEPLYLNYTSQTAFFKELQKDLTTQSLDSLIQENSFMEQKLEVESSLLGSYFESLQESFKDSAELLKEFQTSQNNLVEVLQTHLQETLLDLRKVQQHLAAELSELKTQLTKLKSYQNLVTQETSQLKETKQTQEELCENWHLEYTKQEKALKQQVDFLNGVLESL